MPEKAELLPPKFFEFTPEQIELIKRMHSAAGLTNDEFEAFLHFCRRKRVDPLLKQAYATKRKMKDGSSVVAIMTSIEGLRAIADRTREYAPGFEPEFVEDPKGKLIAAKVSVKKYVQGEWHELKGVAYLAEFDQHNFMWDRMPRNQLAKCAEAQALRKGWPEDCGGFYVPEEFNQEQPDEPQETEKKNQRERGSIKKLKASSEPNRGHGNEGIGSAVCNEGDNTSIPSAQTARGSVPFDNYSTTIVEAITKSNKEKIWAEVKVSGGVSSVWNPSSRAYRDGKIPETTLYCWHQSLFEALMKRPQNIVLAVVNKEGSKWSPIIEDILAIDGEKFEKGGGANVHPDSGANDTQAIANRRQESIAELSAMFEKLWPAAKLELRSIRNEVGQVMLNLQSKDQLKDASYPQANIDAAIRALKQYDAMEPKATTREGTIEDITHMFKEALNG